MPKELDQKLRENHKEFYCPNGHKQWYVGESEAEKLRRELKRKEQEVADQVRARLQAQSDLDKAERKLKRVAKGVCPCCNRSFANLHKHMETKHPEVVKKKKS
jgi:DNA repair exonuclease SbcCD ATPase subunit